jgi:hypothetical protein
MSYIEGKCRIPFSINKFAHQSFIKLDNQPSNRHKNVLLLSHRHILFSKLVDKKTSKNTNLFWKFSQKVVEKAYFRK